MAEPQSKADRIFGPEEEEVEALRAAAKVDRDRSSIEQGRRIGGLPGAMMAGAMIALRDIYEGPKRDDGVVTVDAPSEPHDVDRDGVELSRRRDRWRRRRRGAAAAPHRTGRRRPPAIPSPPLTPIWAISTCTIPPRCRSDRRWGVRGSG